MTKYKYRAFYCIVYLKSNIKKRRYNKKVIIKYFIWFVEQYMPSCTPVQV